MNNEHGCGGSIKPRVFVIGIDGVPFTFLQRMLAKGEFPNLGNISDGGDMKQMNSVIPPISSVAWTTFMTGKNPAKHGIMGFIDRDPATMAMKIPTSVDIKEKSLWEILGEHGRKVVAMNVPISYPPKKVNGSMVSCFLATNIDKATYPPQLAGKLKEMGYIIDADPWKARSDLDGYLEDLFTALEKRLEATLYLLDTDQPDFMISHIMETDRIGHFFWEYLDKNDEKYAPLIMKFFRKVDDFIGTVSDRLPEETTIIVMSDHGFCTLKKEVYVNVPLREAGYLKLNSEEAKSPADIHPDTKAYSMIPGRFFINLKGREKNGSVEPGAQYDRLRAELKDFLLTLTDPDTGEPIIKSVFKREEIYSGPLFDLTADLVALPHDGYDLKGNLLNPSFTQKDAIIGMHTYWDAALCVRGCKIIDVENLNIADVMPSILSLYPEIPTAGLRLDGRNVFERL